MYVNEIYTQIVFTRYTCREKKQLNLVSKKHFICSRIMFLLISVLFLIKTVESVDIVQRPNGYFITGKGCGTTNPIRYLTLIPKVIKNYQCSFIELQNSRPLTEGEYLAMKK